MPEKHIRIYITEYKVGGPNGHKWICTLLYIERAFLPFVFTLGLDFSIEIRFYC